MSTDLNVPAGKLFCFSRGEYSDYGYIGHFLALQDITSESFIKVKTILREKIVSGDLLGRWDEIVAPTDDDDIESAMVAHFLPEFIRQGWVLEIDCKEIHLYDYSTLCV